MPNATRGNDLAGGEARRQGPVGPVRAIEPNWCGPEGKLDLSVPSDALETLVEFKVATKQKVLDNRDQDRICRFLSEVLDAYSSSAARHDGSSAVTHPVRVALMLVRDLGMSDPDMIMAGLGHDVVEERLMTFEKLSKLGSDNVASAVSRLTKRDFDSEAMTIKLKDDLNPNSHTTIRNELYRDWVKELLNDPDLFRIKLADLAENWFSLDKLGEDRVRRRLHKYSGVVQDIIDELRSESSQGASLIPKQIRDELARHFEATLSIGKKLLDNSISFSDWKNEAARQSLLAQKQRPDD